LFLKIEKKNLFFSYFQIDQKYYILIFAEEAFELDFIYKFLNIIQELNTKKRRIRSFRGFFLYALEIINQGRYFQVLETNMKPYFWTEIGHVIRQNRKLILLNFLFDIPSLENYQNQIKFLKKKMAELEENQSSNKQLI
jgi:hypothetical protein